MEIVVTLDVGSSGRDPSPTETWGVVPPESDIGSVWVTCSSTGEVTSETYATN